MSAKNRDNKNRWRNITVGFRVSPEENELINKAVALSGLPKQEYCYRRCLNQDVVVQGNPRVFKALKTELAAVLTELKRIEAGNSVDDGETSETVTGDEVHTAGDFLIEETAFRDNGVFQRKSTEILRGQN